MNCSTCPCAQGSVETFDGKSELLVSDVFTSCKLSQAWSSGSKISRVDWSKSGNVTGLVRLVLITETTTLHLSGGSDYLN